MMTRELQEMKQLTWGNLCCCAVHFMWGAMRSLTPVSVECGTDGVCGDSARVTGGHPGGDWGALGRATLDWEEHWAAATQCQLPKPLGRVQTPPGESENPVCPSGGHACGP